MSESVRDIPNKQKSDRTGEPKDNPSTGKAKQVTASVAKQEEENAKKTKAAKPTGHEDTSTSHPNTTVKQGASKPTDTTVSKSGEPASQPTVKKTSKPVSAAPKATSTAAAKNVEEAVDVKKAPQSTVKRKAGEKTGGSSSQPQMPDQATIDRMVAEAAYYLAEKRNFATGYEEEDWATAKEQIMAQLRGAKNPLGKKTRKAD